MDNIDFNKPFVLETTIDDWKDITSFNQLFLSNYIYRGQSNSTWRLQPSLNRFVNDCNPNSTEDKIFLRYEQAMLDEFIYKYPLYDSTKNIDKFDRIEWLTLMQHYGAPTRLLDFSKSIFVALYFALDGSYQNESAIWAINSRAIQNSHIIKCCKKNNVKYDYGVPTCILHDYIQHQANMDIGTLIDAEEDPIIYPIFPKIVNERIAIQQGLFLMANDLNRDFEQVLFNYLQINDNTLKVKASEFINLSNHKSVKEGIRNLVMFKVNIPCRFKWELTQLLNQMNLTAETLYPGLTGMAKSLARVRFRQKEIYTE